MTKPKQKPKHKVKRGRPFGGKHPEPIRQYWRQLQREYRQKIKQIQGKKKKGRKPK